MRFVGKIKGFRNDHHTGELFQATEFQINYTSDLHGKTLSIADLNTEVQYSIPFDKIFNVINERRA